MTGGGGVARCPRCNASETRVAPGKGRHAARLDCARCGRWLAWLSKALVDDLTQGELTNAPQRFADRGGRR